MTDLTDANLKAMAAPRGRYGSIVRAMARELLDFRAVVAAHPTGPDQDEPAAAEPYQWAVEGPAVRTFDTKDDALDFADAWDAKRSDGVPPCEVFPLYRRGAPDPVAAALAEEEADRVAARIFESGTFGLADEATRDLRQFIWAQFPMTRPGRHLADLLDAGWRLVPPAPSPGDDGAAAEGASVAWRKDATGEVTTDPAVANRWAHDDFDGMTALVNPAGIRAALAAARGPRTQDDTP